MIKDEEIKQMLDEHSWMMAKLSGGPEDNGNEFVEYAESICLKRLKEIYGELVPEEFIKRAKREIRAFAEIGQLENIFKLSDHLHKLINKGELVVPRLSTGNSLVLFLFGISNVNPMPKHHYCRKCHTFHWGKKENDICEYCGEPLVEDGFCLPFEMLIGDIQRMMHPFVFSTSGKTEINNSLCKLYSVDELKFAKKLGITQKDLLEYPNNIEEVIRCFNQKYYSEKYKRKDIVDHPAFIGLGDLGNRIIQQCVLNYDVKTFEEFINVVTMMHGIGVNEANSIYHMNIYSRDDLYASLRYNQLSNDDALLICRETRLEGYGHLSSLSESKLKEAGVNNEFIDYLKSIHYIFHKAHVIASLKVSLKLADIYLKEPERFYRAYFSLHKKTLLKIGKVDDLIKKIVELKSTELEQFLFWIIDYKERYKKQ